MRRKELNPVHLEIACGVCDRTMLKGEHPGSYLAPTGGRYAVCALCAPRAEGTGWLRETAEAPPVRAGREAAQNPRATAPRDSGRDPGPAARRARPAPRRTVLSRVLAWLGEEPPEPVASPETVHPPAAGPVAAGGHPPAHGHAPAHGAGEGPARRRRPAPHTPDHGPRRRGESRHVRAVPTTADVKVERALEIFNASEHRRRVAGITRSLGEPWVSATPSESSSSEIVLVVAWELSWYRYRVDLADRVEPVRLLDRGEELHQLGTTALWNGAAGPDGRLLAAVQ